jgi:hypothetical protein
LKQANLLCSKLQKLEGKQTEVAQHVSLLKQSKPGYFKTAKRWKGNELN